MMSQSLFYGILSYYLFCFSLVCVQCTEGKYAYNDNCQDCPKQAYCTNGILRTKPGYFIFTKWSKYIILMKVFGGLIQALLSFTPAFHIQKVV